MSIEKRETTIKSSREKRHNHYLNTLEMKKTIYFSSITFFLWLGHETTMTVYDGGLK